jgi:SAM-dependent methyltransferase
VSSSNFPKYDRHLNGAEAPGLAREAAVAEQRVLCGGDAASRLVLTVLDGAGEAELADPAAALRGERPAPSGGSRRRSRRLLAPLAAAVRRLATVLEAQTAKPSGAAGRVVGVLLLLVNPRLNRWTLEPLRVAPTDEVLEIGFGPGATVRRLARRAARGRVAGIDHSEVMVRQARRRNAAAIRRGRVDLRLGDVAALPFPGASFDKVVAVNSVQLWPDPVESLRRVRRVLRPGGLVALSLGQPRWTLGEAAVRAAARRLGGQLAAAGFTLVAMDVRRLGFLHAYRAVARRPEAGAE